MGSGQQLNTLQFKNRSGRKQQIDVCTRTRSPQSICQSSTQCVHLGRASTAARYDRCTHQRSIPSRDGSGMHDALPSRKSLQTLGAKFLEAGWLLNGHASTVGTSTSHSKKASMCENPTHALRLSEGVFLLFVPNFLSDQTRNLMTENKARYELSDDSGYLLD